VTDALDRLRQAKKVAFVFSGGSSRCAFQVGVIERLNALGIHASMTIGVSAGAWNAAIVAAHIEHRMRFMWRSYGRMQPFDPRNLFVELSPWRYAKMHRRNFARFIGEKLVAPDALPCFISVTRLRDSKNFLFNVRDVERPIDLLLAANFLPPFYTQTPLIHGERFGDGGVSNNAPYELALEQGCDMAVMVAMKGETEGGIYKSTEDLDHEVPAHLRDRVIVIRPRHRLPYAFRERDWSRLLELIQLGDLRTREVLLGERHPETDIRALGEAPSARALRWWRMIRRKLTGARGSAAAAPAPAGPVQP
jgi:predicted acylesterase/phospholipase RssA